MSWIICLRGRNEMGYFIVILLFVFASTASGANQEASGKGWPLMFESKGNKVVVHLQENTGN